MSGAMWRQTSLPSPLNFGTGGEQIARAALGQVMANLEVQCERQEVVWANRDQDWAQVMKIPYAPTRITRPQNFYVGAQPSLVSGEASRFDKWPAITVRCGNRKAAEDREQADQYDVYDVELIIEVLAVAGPFRTDPLEDRSTSDAVDRQYQRLADAIIGSIDVDRSLDGNILPIKRPPTMSPSLPFVKKAQGGAGAWLVYQGMELLYVCTSMAY